MRKMGRRGFATILLLWNIFIVVTAIASPSVVTTNLINDDPTVVGVNLLDSSNETVTGTPLPLGNSESIVIPQLNLQYIKSVVLVSINHAAAPVMMANQCSGQTLKADTTLYLSGHIYSLKDPRNLIYCSYQSKAEDKENDSPLHKYG